MRPHRIRLALALVLPALCAGCGWTPLYAGRETGPAAADLRAIKVDPIPERIGQRLEIALRTSLNPTGIPTPPRYELKTTLSVARSDLGVQSQGIATRGQVDVTATYVLADIATGKPLLTNTVHVADSFDILANGYATVVTEDDARTRTAEELRGEIIARLTIYMQRREGSPES
ncbi:MAG TPA: hypothetical protein VHW66_08960 [Stellaceae bacterium]|jgi:LPS-assembly lipoprotein|nr:hypothetical protein [Stellaceae bacterium]